MWKYKLSVIGLLCFIMGSVHAQTDSLSNIEKLSKIPFVEFAPLDSLPMHPDSIKGFDASKYPIKVPVPLFTSIDVQFDYLNLYTYAVDNRQRMEYGAGILLKNKIYLNATFGEVVHASERIYRNGETRSTGTFYRFGVDYKMDMKPQVAYLKIGLRYGESSYNNRIFYESSNPIFEPDFGVFNLTNGRANWVELVLTSEQKLWQLLWLGWNARLKRLIDFDDYTNEIVNVHHVPGFGNTNGNYNVELNLFLKFKLPLTSRYIK
jgi:hypothetical protein